MVKERNIFLKILFNTFVFRDRDLTPAELQAMRLRVASFNEAHSVALGVVFAIYFLTGLLLIGVTATSEMQVTAWTSHAIALLILG